MRRFQPSPWPRRAAMKTNQKSCALQPLHSESRRALLKSATGIAGASLLGAPLLGAPQLSWAAAMTKDQRDKLTTDQILDAMQRGNERFRTGKMLQHDYL